MYKVTVSDRCETVAMWERQRDILSELECVNEAHLRWLEGRTEAKRIGYVTGQIRPAEEGRADVYFLAEPVFGTSLAIVLSGLTAAQALELERKKGLTAAQIDAEFAKIEDENFLGFIGV